MNKRSHAKAARGSRIRTVIVQISRKLRATYRVRIGGRLFSRLLAALLGVYAAQVFALPQGGVVQSGAVTINTPNANSMVLNQGTSKAVIDWQSFSIGSGQSVQFLQPGASSVALNRVVGGDVSSIFGSLSANGQVFLVNPNGVLFAPGAQVNVGGLVASTLNLSNADFLAGKYTFSGNSGASVVNNGMIRAGYVALAGAQVANAGTIEAAQGGSIGLLAGSRVTVDPAGAGLVKFSVDGAAVDAAASNSGTLVAEGGQVAMLASAVSDTLPTVINQSGVIRANSVAENNGVVTLSGGATGIVKVSGTIEAKGGNAGETGGTVKVLGDRVGLMAGASVDASGDAGGGTVLVGGNFQGKGPEQNATVTVVQSGASIRADAVVRGDGGEVIVWADGSTRFAGAIDVRGGAAAGNGGFVEVSGKEHLAYVGTVDANGGQGGQKGTLLLDPGSVEIVGAGGNADSKFLDFSPSNFTYFDVGAPATSTLTASQIVTQLNGSNVIILVPDAPGTLKVSAAVDATGNAGAGNLILSAAGDVTIDAAVNVKAGSSFQVDGANVAVNADVNTLAGSGNTWFKANTGNMAVSANVGNRSNAGSQTQLEALNGTISGAGTISGDVVILKGGSIGSAVSRVNTAANQLQTSGSDAFIQHSGAVKVFSTATNTFDLVAGGTIDVGMVQAAGVKLAATGVGSSITSTGGTVTATSGDVLMSAGKDISLAGAVSAAAGTVTANVGLSEPGAFSTTASVTSSGGTTINGGAFDDTFAFGSAVNATVNGGGGTDTLVGRNLANTWTISGANSGNYNTEIVFNDVENITGNASGDQFTFSAGGSLSGRIDGMGGTDTVNYAAATAVTNVKLGSDVVNVETLTGATGQTLTGADITNAWALTNPNAGLVTDGDGVGTASFSGFGSIAGGTGNDTFTVASGSNFVGTVSGGGGAGVDTLVATDGTNAWAITGANSGTLNTGANTNFSGIASLKGGTGADTFTFGAAGTLSGQIDGDFGADSVDYSLAAGVTNVTLGTNVANVETLSGAAGQSLTGANAANAWSITDANAGSINGTVSFAGFGGLVGGTGNDTFTVASGKVFNGSIAGGGGAGVDTLAATDGTNAWAITGANAGTLNTKTTFSGIANLAGGTGTDTFAGTGTFNVSAANTVANGGVTGTSMNALVGGAGDDTFAMATGVTFAGTIDGGTGNNTVSATDNANTWNVTGAGVGNLNGTANFNNIANLTGGAGADTFVFADAGSITGVIDGGDPTTAAGDAIDLTAKTGLVAINTATGTATGMGSFTNIEQISGNNAGTTLTGSDINITGVNSGSADGVGFQGVHNLQGTATSSITGLLAGSVAGTIIDGGTATTLSGVINSGGNQSYTGAVTLAAATTTAGANVTFDNTVGGAQALTINSAGTTTLNGNVDVASLTTDAAGTTSIGAASIKTSGAQTYGDAVTQTVAATILESGSNVTLTGGLGGNKALTVKTNGSLSLGAATTVASLTTQGTTTLTGAGALTTPVVNAQGNLKLGNANQIADGATVNVTGTLDTGANAETVGKLNVNGGTVNGTGVLTSTGGYNLTSATVNGALGAGTLTQVGGASTLAGTSAASTVNIEGGTLTLGNTANRLTAANSVGIAAGATLDTGAAAQALASGAVTNSGTLTTAGAISAGSITSSGTASYGGNVTTTGAQTYTGTLSTAANSTLEAAGSLTSTNADATTIGDGTTFRMTDTGTVDVSGNYQGSVKVDGSASSVTLTDFSAETPFVVNQMMVDSGANVTLNSAGALTVDAANLSQLAKLTVRVAEGGVRFLNSSTERNGQKGILATGGITMQVDEGDVNTETDPMWINAGTPNLSVTINGAFKAWLAGNVSSDAVTRKFLNDAADGVGASRAEMVRDFLHELKRNVGIGAVEDLVLFGGIDMEGIIAPLSFSNLAVKLPKCAGEQANSQQCN